jgi:hypothetical protein
VKTWMLAKSEAKCGSCGLAIPAGAPMLTFTGIGSTGAEWSKFRCYTCAEHDGHEMPDSLADESIDTRVDRAKETAATVAVRFTGAAQKALWGDES